MRPAGDVSNRGVSAAGSHSSTHGAANVDSGSPAVASGPSDPLPLQSTSIPAQAAHGKIGFEQGGDRVATARSNLTPASSGKRRMSLDMWMQNIAASDTAIAQPECKSLAAVSTATEVPLLSQPYASPTQSLHASTELVVPPMPPRPISDQVRTPPQPTINTSTGAAAAEQKSSWKKRIPSFRRPSSAKGSI